MKKRAKEPLVRYDVKADAIYILTRKGAEEEVVEMAPGVNLELNEQGGGYRNRDPQCLQAFPWRDKVFISAATVILETLTPLKH